MLIPTQPRSFLRRIIARSVLALSMLLALPAFSFATSQPDPAACPTCCTNCCGTFGCG